MSGIKGDMLIVPSRVSFLADDQLGFVQAADFQSLTGLDDLIGAVLVLDGAASTSTLFVGPRNPLLTRGAIAPDSAGTEAWELHGVGLDDAEGLPEVLRAGMVVAYELMFTVDGDGFYLEDMIAVKDDGYEILTSGLPYTAREIETAMASRIRPGNK
jgi:hypothetical protein